MQQMAQTDSMVGVAEASRMLKKHKTTVQRWGRSGKLPIAFEMPGATGVMVFRRADVEALAAAEPVADESKASAA